jgi:hypothetical protein
MHLQLFITALFATAALAMPVAAPCEADVGCTESLTRRFGGYGKTPFGYGGVRGG